MRLVDLWDSRFGVQGIESVQGLGPQSAKPKPSHLDSDGIGCPSLVAFLLCVLVAPYTLNPKPLRPGVWLPGCW